MHTFWVPAPPKMFYKFYRINGSETDCGTAHILAGHPTDEQLLLLNISSNNNLPSVLFKWKEFLFKKAQINGCQTS